MFIDRRKTEELSHAKSKVLQLQPLPAGIAAAQGQQKT
jgi:hypothetical protein